MRVAGTNLFEPTLLGNFRLGGFLELSGLRTGELEGQYLGRARAVFLLSIHMPSVERPGAPLCRGPRAPS